MSNSENAGLEGKWNLVLKGPTGKQPSTLVVERSGDALSGSQLGSQGVATPISDVVIDGMKVSWVNTVTKPMTLKIVFTGEFAEDGNTISGKAKIGFMGTYPFTATKE
ncbi:MAG: hypothetical protein ABW352_03805 [Polyangiales bacterium]